MSLNVRQAWMNHNPVGMNHHPVGMNHHLLQLTHWRSFFFSGWPINWNWEYRFAINCNCNSENAINCNCTPKNAINFPGLLQILQWIVIVVNMLAPLFIGSAEHVPLGVLLHFILQQLCALYKNQWEPFSSMLCQIRISLSVCAPPISGLGLIRVSHNNRNIHIRFVVTLRNGVLQNC